MRLAVYCLGGTALVLLFFLWCMTQIHFRIGSRYLKIMLFGMAIRRIALSDIAYAGKRDPKGFAERWYSTLKTSHRLLVIERKTGLRKYVCITPQNRYVFLADLKSAIRRVDPTAEWAALRTYEDTTHLFKGVNATAEPNTPVALSASEQAVPQTESSSGSRGRSPSQ
jgi:hypothetical protein